MLYTVLKHTHVAAVVASGALFAYRFYRLQRYPRHTFGKLLKWAPHINDTLLLGAAVGMLVILGVNPVKLSWLSFKLMLLPVYIGFGALCLRALPGSVRQRILFLVAALIYVVIAATAVGKNGYLPG